MTLSAPLRKPYTPLDRMPAPSCEAASLTDAVRAVAHEANADHHLLAELTPDRDGRLPVLSCDWPYDAVIDVGFEAISRMLASPFATFPGATPQPVHPLMMGAILGDAAVAALGRTGDSQFFLFRLLAGTRRYGAIFSTVEPGRISAFDAARAQLRACHILSDFAGERSEPSCGSRLSQREIDCLRWVSQGKTTEEVAVILGVSANTINNYIAHSISKLAASNRAMATAIALREGLI